MATVNTLAAYIHLKTAPGMPTPILDAEGNLDITADNASIEAWSMAVDVFNDVDRDLERLGRFLVDLDVLLIDITNETNPEEYMTHFYDAAKRTFDEDKKQIRTWFSWLYLIMFQRAEGPRWGDFVQIYGADEFVAFVRTRLENLV
jgi:lysyl-tRNA synthetase class I